MRHGKEAVRRYFGIDTISVPDYKQLNRRYITAAIGELKSLGQQEVPEDEYPDVSGAENELYWLVGEIDELEEYADNLSDQLDIALSIIEDSEKHFDKVYDKEEIKIAINEWITKTIRNNPETTLEFVEGVNIAQIAAESIGAWCLFESVFENKHFKRWKSSCQANKDQTGRICGAVQYMELHGILEE